MNILIHNRPPDRDLSAIPYICQTDIWSLQKTGQHNLIFSTKKSRNRRVVNITQDYSQAQLYGQFMASNGLLWHPLENLDMLMVVNWLAEQGDLAVHASGMIVDGKGYAFLGKSGAGKSTLAAALARDHQAVVLGEDQVILRYLEDTFWMYGTPWHERSAMCSPARIPLAGIFFLDREGGLGLGKLAGLEGVSRLLQNAFLPFYRSELLPVILDRVALLAARVPFYSLNYPLGYDVFQHEISPLFDRLQTK